MFAWQKKGPTYKVEEGTKDKDRSIIEQNAEGLFLLLADETLLEILRYLGIPELGALCCTASRLKGIAESDELWKLFFDQHLSNWLPALSTFERYY